MAKGPDLWQGARNLLSRHGGATDTHLGAAYITLASSLCWPRLHQPRSVSASQLHLIAHHQRSPGRPTKSIFAHPPYAAPPPCPSQGGQYLSNAAHSLPVS